MTTKTNFEKRAQIIILIVFALLFIVLVTIAFINPDINFKL